MQLFITYCTRNDPHIKVPQTGKETAVERYEHVHPDYCKRMLMQQQGVSIRTWMHHMLAICLIAAVGMTLAVFCRLVNQLKSRVNSHTVPHYACINFRPFSTPELSPFKVTQGQIGWWYWSHHMPKSHSLVLMATQNCIS